MKINNKHHSEIETQTAAFLLSGHVSEDLPYDGMARAAKQLIAHADDETRLNAIIAEQSTGPKIADATEVKDAYVRFLRGQNDLGRQERKLLTPYVAEYEKFRKSIELMQKDSDMLLGKGIFSEVYRLPFIDEYYAVRIPSGYSAPAMNEVHKHLQACMRVADLPCVEKLVAASYIEGITVSEVAPGKDTSELSLEQFDDITEEQISALGGSLHIAFERGVGFDSEGKNLFYDPEVGFTAIDLGMTDPVRKRSDGADVNAFIERSINRGFDTVTAGLQGFEMSRADRYRAALNTKIKSALGIG